MYKKPVYNKLNATKNWENFVTPKKHVLFRQETNFFIVPEILVIFFLVLKIL